MGTAKAEAAVHIDARDSGRLPRVTGGLAWHVTITEEASNHAVPILAVEDLSDGTYKVRFRGERAGLYRLHASLPQAGNEEAETLSATVELRPPLEE